MIITNSVLQALRTQLCGEFKQRWGELAAKAIYNEVATTIKSKTVSNTYGWLGQFPALREWVGERVIKDMKEFSYQLTNRKFESTIDVDRAAIEDDNWGQYSTLAREMADACVRFFNKNVADLLAGGFENLCYDGQNFFDADHPVYPNEDGTGTPVDVSNIIGTGAEGNPPWFLLSLDGSLKPLILQERTVPEFDSIQDVRNNHVFMLDKYLYGIRWRGEFGYGLWQQAVGSQAVLNAANYEAARLKMATVKRDGNIPIGIVPTHLVVSPENESAGRAILEKEFLAGGESNANYHSAKLLVLPHLSPAGAPAA